LKTLQFIARIFSPCRIEISLLDGELCIQGGLCETARFEFFKKSLSRISLIFGINHQIRFDRLKNEWSFAVSLVAMSRLDFLGTNFLRATAQDRSQERYLASLRVGGAVFQRPRQGNDRGLTSV
jgi:hypothetical protein